MPAKNNFVQKYPYSKMDEFEFWVNNNQDCSLNLTTIVYKRATSGFIRKQGHGGNTCGILSLVFLKTLTRS